MKIWRGYGSEHSMNLVMIGHFKTVHDANDVHKIIDKIIDGLDGKVEVGSHERRYRRDVMEFLTRLDCFMLTPSELEQFFYDNHVSTDGNKLVIQTEEHDVSAFLKLLVDKGARVEVFSAHDYPGSGYGRGEG